MNIKVINDNPYLNSQDFSKLKQLLTLLDIKYKSIEHARTIKIDTTTIQFICGDIKNKLTGVSTDTILIDRRNGFFDIGKRDTFNCVI